MSSTATGGAGGAAPTIDFKVGQKFQMVVSSGDSYPNEREFRDATITHIIPSFLYVVELDLRDGKTVKEYTENELNQEVGRTQLLTNDLERRSAAYKHPNAVARRAAADRANAATAPARVAAAAARDAADVVRAAATRVEADKLAAQKRVRTRYTEYGTPFDLSIIPLNTRRDVSSMNMCYMDGKKITKVIRPTTYSTNLIFEDGSEFENAQNKSIYTCLSPFYTTRGRRQRKTRKANSRRNRLRA